MHLLLYHICVFSVCGSRDNAVGIEMAKLSIVEIISITLYSHTDPWAYATNSTNNILLQTSDELKEALSRIMKS